MKDEGLIDIEFVKSKENTADLFTNNLESELYENHSSKLFKDGWK